MTEKLKIDRPVIVEGRYDRETLSRIIDADIIATDGFGVFRSDEKKKLIRRLAEKNGVIVLTDSDGAGLVIRNYFNSILPKDRIIHLYTPRVAGKEPRKKTVSREGILGVEGTDPGLLRALFEPLCGCGGSKNAGGITKADMYADSLSGRGDSAARRDRLCEKLGLPPSMSANSLLAAINLLCTRDEYREMVDDDQKNQTAVK